MKKIIIPFLALALITTSCKKKDETPEPEPTPSTTGGSQPFGQPDSVWATTGTGPHLIFKFKFDSTQVRLNNFGNPSPTLPSGHGAYSPKFNKMAAHYIELAQTDFTQLGAGKVLYHAPETTKGGTNAIEFDKSTVVRENVTFYSVPISSITAGSYKWLRLSLSYQNYDIPYKASTLVSSSNPQGIGYGTLASFLGFRTYVEHYTVKTQTFVPSSSAGGAYANHNQGYWGFETFINGYGYFKLDGQAQSGATTVVNPNPNSPIPAGSCVVTAVFTDSNGNPLNLTITGNETQDIIVTVSLSTNKSFEWTEVNSDGYYQPDIGEAPVDMGIRGMIPKVQY